MQIDANSSLAAKCSVVPCPCILRSARTDTGERTGVMNLEQLKKNRGWRMQLHPPPFHLDDRGHELPHRDIDWLFAVTSDNKALNLWDFRIGSSGQPLTLDEAKLVGLDTTIGSDIVHRFDSDRSRGDEFGFLVLNQQMYIQRARITFRPCWRPGERVNPPPPIEAQRIEVSSDYLWKSGILANLESQGYEVHGIRETRLADVELDGWELVVESDADGRLRTFHSSGLIYIKRRKVISSSTPNYDLTVQGTCPNCGLVTYLYGRDELREDLSNSAPLKLVCTNCNDSRNATELERQRLLRIAEAAR